ncbi:MAG: hypothetical protein ACK4GC_09535 [Paracoccaceae bacterium]
MGIPAHLVSGNLAATGFNGLADIARVRKVDRDRLIHGICVLDDGVGLVAHRREHIPNGDPPAVRVISNNKLYPEHERTAEDIRVIGRIRWFARVK